MLYNAVSHTMAFKVTFAEFEHTLKKKEGILK